MIEDQEAIQLILENLESVRDHTQAQLDSCISIVMKSVAVAEETLDNPQLRQLIGLLSEADKVRVKSVLQEIEQSVYHTLDVVHYHRLLNTGEVH